MDMERGGKIFYLGSRIKDFPGGPVVKTVSSSAGGMGSIPGRELRSHMWDAAKILLKRK